MSNLSIEELANLAASTEDQTETKAGGDFEYTPPPAGRTVARFIEYIELGKQKQAPYQGKPKADAEMVRLTFELLGAKHISEIEVDGGKKTIANRISVTLNKNFGEKAKFKKLFNKMVYGREGIKHFTQMLGQAFLVDVILNTGEKTKKVYANIRDSEGNWLVSAPRIQQGGDPLAGIEGEWVDITSKVPANISPLRIFLWDHPNKDCWDSLFIDGTRKVKQADGTEVEQSRNWLQQMIKDASNFGGSPIEQLIGGVADLPATEQEAAKQETNEPPFEPDNKPDATAALAELEQQKAPATSAKDDLAALGL